MDNTLVGNPPATANQASLMWDSTSVANGAHAIRADAYDVAGNVSMPCQAAITVANP